MTTKSLYNEVRNIYRRHHHQMDGELIDSFNDTLDFIRARIQVEVAVADWVAELKAEQNIDKELAYWQSKQSQCFDEFGRSLYQDKIDDCSARMLKQQRQEAWSNKDTKSTQIPLEELKQYPITAICDAHGIARIKMSDKRERVSCPMHNEKTPSCVLYLDNNTFHCFGCAKGTSNIDFLMAVDNCTATEAIKKLRAIIGVKH